ncbi:SWIM zinc finger family protein [Actinospica robiniae]|uniref:SWIM zinc finger family protein n=1 Tax=Actinospica robiniae TaxID=304901 RepID=UPI000554EC62|nr:SWIM zinc finger family protein [Actinospica robiniae]
MALAFIEDDLRNAAGPMGFERGLNYRDCVEELDIGPDAVDAIVVGSFEYDVTLSRERGALAGQCSCPWGQEGNFCKHCVAVGLAVLAAWAAGGPTAATGPARPDLDAWLESLTEAELREELRVLIRGDRELRRRFELRVAQAGQDAGQVHGLVRQLLRRGGREFIDYEDGDAYAVRVEEAGHAIEGLIEAGAAEEAMLVCREAAGFAIEALATAEDANGSIYAAVTDLLPLHLRAARAARPDPLELARHLAEHNLADELDLGHDVGEYTDLLGAKGFAHLRDVVAAAYERNPKGARERRFMEELVRRGGDLDELVTLLSRDLDSYGRQHLRIAIDLDGAGRDEEALKWAETGLRESTGFVGTDLVEFVALRYTQAGRFKDLLRLRRERFSAELTVSHYELLRETATAMGLWEAERGRAMALLRRDAAKQGPLARYGMGPVLIDVLIAEGDFEGAWEQARRGSSEPQRLKLAALIRQGRPAEALEVYQRALESLRTQTGEEAYRRVLELLQGVQACHAVLGTPGGFAAYLAAFRTEQKRKRNLIRLLDAAGLA